MPVIAPRPARVAALALAVLAVGAVVPAVAAPVTRSVLPVAASAQKVSDDTRACAPARPGWRTCFAIVRNAVAAAAAPSARTPSAQAAAVPAVHGPAGGLTPYALAKAYGINASAPTDQVVAVIDAFDDPRIWFELNAFDSRYGLPPETTDSFARVDQRGGRNFPAQNSGWVIEEVLDVEAVRAVCHLCRIRLVEADSSSSADLAQAVNAAVQMGAKIVSNSYGGPESASEPAWIRQAYNHPGVVVTASTGDDGWYGWDRTNNGVAADDRPDSPAAYPEVVAVAGTKLMVNADGTAYGERVWNRNGPADSYGLKWGARGASGGGCSHVYSAPAWQTALHGYQLSGCNGKRMVGDVAADADPTTGLDVYAMPGGRGQWMTVGGTSLASPLIAGMWAVSGGAGGVKSPAQILYDNQRTRPGTYFDVQVGSNAFCGASDLVVSKYACSSTLVRVAGTGNPNNMSFDNGNWAGAVDCGWNLGGSSGTLANDRQCRAGNGYDGPSGVGAPRSSAFFRPS